MRLIDGDTLKQKIHEHDYRLRDEFNTTDRGMFTIGIDYAIDNAPTVSPKQGRWIEIDDELITGTCSVCGWDAIFAETDVVGMPYCPNCGAYMKGEEG